MPENYSSKKQSKWKLFVLSAMFFVPLTTGCFNQKEPWEVTHPVAGVVTYKGRPVPNAELSFFPLDDSYPDTVRPKAKSTEDGKFVVWTFTQGDGAPVGAYKVTVVHHEVAVSQGTIVAKPNDLPPKYASKDSTTLEVQINEGQNEIPPIAL